jgi:exopolyphosphatase/guanosine-5'-triphosphate,3'-diphosphate pyrophosphatase
MMMKRAAILDLGTNTFNLLIVESTTGTDYKILINHKIPVKLGEGRINDGEIIPVAYTRGIKAVLKHYKTIEEYNVTEIKAFGTSAFRTARNGQQFLDELLKLKNLKIEIISGNREAELIYLGVRQTLHFSNEKFVVIDIGGGSNELIIADMQQILWKKSYNLGVARLLERFHPSDPINPSEIASIKNYLSEEISDLFEALKKFDINIMVGASGSFETFVTMLEEIEVDETICMIKEPATVIQIDQYNQLFEKIIRSTLSERKNMKGLEPMRTEMIVLASLFVKFILENHNFNHIIQSNFALKEGAIFELINEKN